MVLKYINGDEERIRVIYIDNERENVYYVDIDKDSDMPKLGTFNKINEEIESKILIPVSDPYLRNIEEDRLSEIEKEKRDANWKIINDTWNTNKLDIVDEIKRHKILRQISKDYSINISTLRRMFCRFFQRGMTKNSLLSDYRNSGGKGKEKKLKESKVGRPKKHIYDDNSNGINITDEIKLQFEVAVNRYYRKANKISIKETYEYILKDFFSNKVMENGEYKYKVWPISQIPTYDQFYYWFKKNENIKKDIIFRDGAKQYELTARPILSNSTLETEGPGTKFQIDATIADVYLVSELDRSRIIGRPVVYAIIDVFSRLVTGIYVGLEGPSWIGAMMALDNMVADKVEFCNKYDITITEDEWPAKHLPEIIISDRGEGESYCAKNLINNLNVKFETTPSYRGDLKGIVERHFRILNTEIKHKAPGAIQKEYRKRGDEDYRLDATLTLPEFTQIYINLILTHNSKINDKYQITRNMMIDGVIPIPLNLWNWGIENKKGRLRIVDRESFRINVLPRDNATISRAGIKFKGLFYGSQKAINEQWFLKGNGRSIEVIYDPRDMNNIYIQNDVDNTFETCYLLEPSKQYSDLILEEIEFNFNYIARLKAMEKQTQIQNKIDLDTEINEIVKKAKQEKNEVATEVNSKSAKIKNIRNNRAVEKEINRNSEVFILGEELNFNNKGEVIELPIIKDNEISNNSTSKSRLIDKLRKKRDENREK